MDKEAVHQQKIEYDKVNERYLKAIEMSGKIN